MADKYHPNLYQNNSNHPVSSNRQGTSTLRLRGGMPGGGTGNNLISVDLSNASQSSTWDAQHIASKAIDGDTRKNNGTGHKTIAATYFDNDPWWSAHYDTSLAINTVVVINRDDNPPSTEYYKNIKISVWLGNSPNDRNFMCTPASSEIVLGFTVADPTDPSADLDASGVNMYAGPNGGGGYGDVKTFIFNGQTDFSHVTVAAEKTTRPKVLGIAEVQVFGYEKQPELLIRNDLDLFFKSDQINSGSYNGESLSDFSHQIINLDTSGVTSMRATFYNSSEFNLPIGGWNVTRVQNMMSMFNSASIFNQYIGHWNVSAVTNMESMFEDASGFNQNIGNWDVGRVGDMNNMFRKASGFNQYIGNWNVTNVQNMESMFQKASSFNENINGWNVSNVNIMSSMFNGASEFNQNIGSWNVSEVTDMDHMFYDATNFNQDISGWDVSRVKDMANMFKQAYRFNQNISGWNVSVVTNMESMFQDASGFNENLIYWNVSNVINASNMFTGSGLTLPGGLLYGINNLNNRLNNIYSKPVQDIWKSLWPQINAGSNLDSSFEFNVIQFGEYNLKNLSMFSHIFSDMIINLDTSGVTSMNSTFLYASSFNLEIGSWNVSGVTNMDSMFYGANVFNQDISGWDINNLQSASDIFTFAGISIGGVVKENIFRGWSEKINNTNANAIGEVMNSLNIVNLENLYKDSSFNQDISGWNVSGVTNMNNIFDNTNIDYTLKNNIFISWNGQINSKNANAIGQLMYSLNIVNLENLYKDSSFNQDISGWNVSKVNDMNSMFYGAFMFNQNIGNWNVSNVTNMTSMFEGASVFNQYIGNWNVSEVTSMLRMFYEASKFNQDIGGWNVSKVESMEGMFLEANSFNQDISGWNVTGVMDMGAMFYNANLFNQDIGTWNVSGVTDMRYMFEQASSFNQNIGGWNVSEVTNMNSIFRRATSFNQNIGGWNLSKVKDIGDMFYNADSFNQYIGDWNVSDVENMNGMFKNAKEFNKDIGSWNVSKVKDMGHMFHYAMKFNYSLIGWNISNVTSFIDIFTGSGLTLQGGLLSDISNLNTQLYNIKQESGQAKLNMWKDLWPQINAGSNLDGSFVNDVIQFGDLKDKDLSLFSYQIINLDISGVTSMKETFKDSTSFNLPIGSWNVSRVKNMELMFGDAKAFNQDITGWNVSNVTNMYGMFWDANNFNQNLSSWNVSNVTDFTHVFRNNSNLEINQNALNQLVYNAPTHNNFYWKLLWKDTYYPRSDDDNLYISNYFIEHILIDSDLDYYFENNTKDYLYDVIPYLDTSGLTSMRGTFRNSTFNQDISNWNVSGVTDMNFMFEDATSFNQNLSGWNVSGVTYMDHMFSGASVFNYNLVQWDISKVRNRTNMFTNSGLEAPGGLLYDISSGVSSFYNEGGQDAWEKLWLLSEIQHSTYNNIGGVWEDSIRDRSRNFYLQYKYQGLDNAYLIIIFFIDNYKYSRPFFSERIFTYNNIYGIFENNIIFNIYDNSYNLYYNYSNNSLQWDLSLNNSDDFSLNWYFDNISNSSASKMNYQTFELILDDNSLREIIPIYQNIQDSNYNYEILINDLWYLWNVSQVTNMHSIFQYYNQFNEYISDWHVSGVTDMNNMFQDASEFNQNISGWNVSGVKDMNNMFRGATNFNQNIDGWNVSGVTDMNSMFERASGFNQYIGGWDVSKVEDMASMFRHADIFNQDISHWNVIEVGDMNNMFRDASGFNQYLGGWNVSQVGDMANMFYNASQFNADIGNWNVSRVTDMQHMFRGAINFNQDITGWNVSGVTDMSGMFMDAYFFNQDISGWNVSNVTNTNNIFGDPSEKKGILFNRNFLKKIKSSWTNKFLDPSVSNEFNNYMILLLESTFITNQYIETRTAFENSIIFDNSKNIKIIERREDQEDNLKIKFETQHNNYLIPDISLTSSIDNIDIFEAEENLLSLQSINIFLDNDESFIPGFRSGICYAYDNQDFVKLNGEYSNNYQSFMFPSGLWRNNAGLYKNSRAFALIKNDRRAVMTCGDENYGANRQTTPDLSNVVKIFSTERAFAAIYSDYYKVTCWGDANYGGDITILGGESEINNVAQIYSTQRAFAARKIDGTVISWGDRYYGGDITIPTGVTYINDVDKIYINNVDQIYSTERAFAALKKDGTVRCWGDASYGGDITIPTGVFDISNVVQIYSTKNAFAALKKDGTVMSWGDPSYGGDITIPTGVTYINNVVQIYSTQNAFAALKKDGTVMSWGDSNYGGDMTIPTDVSDINNVVQIYSTERAFAALKNDGTVTCWGDASYGSDMTIPTDVSDISNVVQIYSTQRAFAALKKNGSVISWGDENYGGDMIKPVNAFDISNVVQIYSTQRAFAALKVDLTVTCWGDASYGGDISMQNGLSELNDIVQIFSNDYNFTALDKNSNVRFWGGIDVSNVYDEIIMVNNDFINYEINNSYENDFNCILEINNNNNQEYNPGNKIYEKKVFRNVPEDNKLEILNVLSLDEEENNKLEMLNLLNAIIDEKQSNIIINHMRSIKLRDLTYNTGFIVNNQMLNKFNTGNFNEIVNIVNIIKNSSNIIQDNNIIKITATDSNIDFNQNRCLIFTNADDYILGIPLGMPIISDDNPNNVSVYRFHLKINNSDILKIYKFKFIETKTDDNENNFELYKYFNYFNYDNSNNDDYMRYYLDLNFNSNMEQSLNICSTIVNYAIESDINLINRIDYKSDYKIIYWIYYFYYYLYVNKIFYSIEIILEIQRKLWDYYLDLLEKTYIMFETVGEDQSDYINFGEFNLNEYSDDIFFTSNNESFYIINYIFTNQQDFNSEQLFFLEKMRNFEEIIKEKLNTYQEHNYYINIKYSNLSDTSIIINYLRIIEEVIGKDYLKSVENNDVNISLLKSSYKIRIFIKCISSAYTNFSDYLGNRHYININLLLERVTIKLILNYDQTLIKSNFTHPDKDFNEPSGNELKRNIYNNFISLLNDSIFNGIGQSKSGVNYELFIKYFFMIRKLINNINELIDSESNNNFTLINNFIKNKYISSYTLIDNFDNYIFQNLDSITFNNIDNLHTDVSFNDGINNIVENIFP